MPHLATAPCQPKRTIWNPDAAELRQRVSRMSNAQHTEFNNYNVTTRVRARSKHSTFIVTDTPQQHTDPCMSRDEGALVSQQQNAYIAQTDMIVIDGYIGSDPKTRTATRLWIEAAYPNIAAMQQQLYFPVPAAAQATFTPTLQVVYTPGLPIDGFPDQRLIAVDLEQSITRVLNSDYFGEA